MKAANIVRISFLSKSVNEGFARGVLSAFLAQADPTVADLADIKTAVSEAVTNCIVHAYPERTGLVYLSIALYEDGLVKVTVSDKGVGIDNVERAMQPMFTTGSPEERAGLGFAVMESFMDKIKVSSKPGHGTRVVMSKQLGNRE